jgi:hypothetical protein
MDGAPVRFASTLSLGEGPWRSPSSRARLRAAPRTG